MNALNTIISLFNFALLIFFLFYWLSSYKKESKVISDRKKLRRKVNKILDKAFEKHDKIVTDAKKVSKVLQSKADKSFESTVEKINRENEAFYKKATTDFESALIAYVNSLQAKGDTEFKNYGEKIQKEMAEKNSLLQQQISQITKSFSQELEQFKQSEKQRVQAQLSQRIDSIVKSLIPANISIEDHDKLVEDSIAKADREGLFR